MFPRPTIIVQLQDGLGNQMFQYARGVALAKRFGARLKFDDSWFKAPPAAGAPLRRYRLDAFACAPAFISARTRERLLGRTPWRRCFRWR